MKRYWPEAIEGGFWKRGRIKDRWSGDFREGPYDYGLPFNLPNHPLVGVSWYEALAYCRWLTDQLKNWAATPEPIIKKIREKRWEIRLPTESQWEKAAGGTDGRIYPWGDKVDPEKANYRETGIGSTSAVGCFPGGASPYGCLDMVGNVWEWTRDIYKPYRYNPEDQQKDPKGEKSRVLRGGAFDDYPWSVRSANRGRSSPVGWDDDVGFRIVLSPSGI